MVTHNWLPHSPVFINAPPINMIVHDLINEESKQWDRGKLFSTFDRHTCETILTMPLNHQTTQEKLVWMENKAHAFTIRTTYQVSLCLQQPNCAEHSSVQAQGNTWKKIWKLNMPPKVHTFLWRTLLARNVHCHGMYGRYSREVSRNAATSLLISSSSFRRCSRGLVSWSWRNGQPQLG